MIFCILPCYFLVVLDFLLLLIYKGPHVRIFSSRKVDKGTIKFDLLVGMGMVNIVNHGRPLVNSYREFIESC